MKRQLLKKLFAFIIVMFSVYFLSAQCASNEILMSLGGLKYCTQRCVKLSQEDKYLKKGWAPFGCPVWGPGLAPASHKSQKVSISVYDLTGRLIKILDNQQMQTGMHQFVWNARDEKGNAVNAGIYFSRMQRGNYSETRKLVVVK